ncbi:MAG: M48 family metallopeptidase [Methylococcaceae bacterium]|nr:M48 family metallopeptidase [Methylococcaceae bacterium]
MSNKIVLILFCCFLSACATSPTGRSQFIYMPDSQLNQMGLQAFDNLKTKKPLSKNSRYNQFAACIAEAITHETGGDWEVVVFEDDSLNAFALPGNKIGVHTGLIKMVENQDQLATVIGHEVGHVLARHSNERMSQKTAINQGVALISAVSSPTSALGQLAVSSLGIGAQYGIILPFSRTHESEADIIGLDLMAKAGFDPRQSINLWKKMDQAGKAQQPAEFMSTHPSHDTRIKDLSEHMSKAMQFYQQAQSIGKRPRCTK